MRRILIGLLFLLIPSLAMGQAAEKVISDTSEDLTAYTVLTGQPKANEGWGRYWGKCGYKDLYGKWVIPPQFEWAGQFHEGYALVVTGAHVHHVEKFFTNWVKSDGFKEREGGEVLIFDGGRLVVIDKMGRERMVVPRPDGKLITTLAWSDSEGRKTSTASPEFMDSRGRNVYRLDEFGFHDSLASVMDKSKKRGFIGTDGQWAIPPSYDNVADFSDGVAAVEIMNPPDARYRWGAIDKSGKMIIAPQFGVPFEFSEGLAFLGANCIDKTGKTVFVVDKSVGDGRGQHFHEGLARYLVDVRFDAGKGTEYATDTFFLDRTGKVAFKFRAECTNFLQKVASCSSRDPGGRIYFDTSGNVVERGGNTARLEKDLAESPVVASRGPNYSPGSKIIRDKAEYQAYMSALLKPDLLAKASAMDEFARKYPKSVANLDAQKGAMLAYLQGGNQARAGELAASVLKLDPDDIRALTLITWVKRMAAAQGDALAAKDAWSYADHGLKLLPAWKKPEAMPDAEFAKARDQSAAVFYGAAGLHSLAAKDFATARDNYQKSLAIQPSNFLDLYQLGIAELAMSPLDVKGFWHIGRAVQVAREQKQPAAEQAITQFGKPIYRNYHGSDEGWEAIVAGARSQAPPAGFTVKRAPGAASQPAKTGPSIDKALSQPVLAKALDLNTNQDKEADEDLKKLKEISDLLGKLNEKDLDDAVGAGLASLPRTKEDDEFADALEAMAAEPGSAKPHTDKAKALREKGDFDGAIREYGEAMQLEPRVAYHYYSRGSCYESKSQFDKALADLNKALELDQNLTNARGARADVYYFTHEYQKAIADYTAFLKTVPNSALAYTRRGTSYDSLKDYRKAIADYEKAIELDPNQLEAYNQLAWLLATAPVDGVRNGAKAVQYGEKAVSLADKNQSFYYMDTLAAAYAEAGRFADAVALQAKAISQIPKDYDAKAAAEMRSRLQLYKTNKPYRDIL